MSAAATRDDLVSVVSALTESAADQRKWEAEYRKRADECARSANEHDEHPTAYTQFRSLQNMYERFASHASGTANGYEVSANMISKYVTVEP